MPLSEPRGHSQDCRRRGIITSPLTAPTLRTLRQLRVPSRVNRHPRFRHRCGQQQRIRRSHMTTQHSSPELAHILTAILVPLTADY